MFDIRDIGSVRQIMPQKHFIISNGTRGAQHDIAVVAELGQGDKVKRISSTSRGCSLSQCSSENRFIMVFRRPGRGTSGWHREISDAALEMDMATPVARCRDCSKSYRSFIISSLCCVFISIT